MSIANKHHGGLGVRRLGIRDQPLTKITSFILTKFRFKKMTGLETRPTGVMLFQYWNYSLFRIFWLAPERNKIRPIRFQK
jgi:hypothetical protein